MRTSGALSLKWGLGHVGLETWPGEDPQTDGAGPIREARGPGRCRRESQKKQAKHCPSTGLSTQQVPGMRGTLGTHQRWSGSGVQGEDAETVLSRNVAENGRGEAVQGSQGDSGSGRESLWGRGRLEPGDRLRGPGLGSGCFTGDSKRGGDVCGPWGQAAGLCFPAAPRTSCVTSGKSLHFSVPPFPLHRGMLAGPTSSQGCAGAEG